MRRIYIPWSVRRAMKVLIDAGFEAYAVGGAVRDSLLGYEPADWDIATNATPEQVMEVFRKAGYRVVPTGVEFGTVTVIDEDRNEYEVTTYRKEFYTEERGRKPVTEWAKTLEEDVKRRDFTINALAADIDGNVIDYVGGIRDIELGVIRFVGNPDERINEDPLRMLRALRFAAKLGFRISDETMEAIRRNAYKIEYISRERIGEEIMKAAKTPRFSEFVWLLKESGLYKYILPEFEDLMRVRHDYRGRHYGETVFQHIIDVVGRCDTIDADPVVKIAAMLHDIAKPHVVKEDEDKITFYGHELVGSELARDIALNRFRYSSAVAGRIATIVRWHHLAYSYPEHYSAEEIAKRMVSKLKEYAPDVLVVNYCDTGDPVYLDAAEIARDILSRESSKPVVSGYDIMQYYGLKPGPEVGLVKELLYALQVMKGITDKSKLLNEACKLGIICRDDVNKFIDRIVRIAGSIEEARKRITDILDMLAYKGGGR